MAKDISMDPDQMEVRAKEFDTAKDDIEDVITDMTSLIGNLETEWKGTASEGFADQYENLKPSFTDMKDLVGDIAQQLRDSAAAVKELDEKIGSKFK